MQVNINIERGTATVLSLYTSSKKLKLKIIHDKQSIYHDIKDKIIVPLTFGNGKYSFILYEQYKGTSYVQKAYINKNITLDKDAYKTSSNYIVNFSEQSNFYQQAKILGSFDKIYEYITKQFAYDYIAMLQDSKQSFSPPNIEACFSKKMGTCYTLSALFVAMLRICNIPASLVVGKVDKQNHAWAEVKGKKYDITAIISGRKPKKYVAQSYY